GDCHDLWIDPKDSRRMILGDDGGGNVTLDGAESWSTLYNQPTAELYHVTTDTREPYRVYAAQQDNTTIAIESQSRYGAITQLDTSEVGGGESGYIAVRPDAPDIVFAGSYKGAITRHDQATGERRRIEV
ncbi:MAG: glycosyl hydrolase, partial [Actinobacteria bacterium]|nr:glycosyl hydrolase [Actinomycetota bacterium]